MAISIVRVKHTAITLYILEWPSSWSTSRICPSWVHRQNVEVTNAEWTKRRTTKHRMPKRRMGQNVDWKKRRMGQNVEWN
jgi:hypothetical protein